MEVSYPTDCSIGLLQILCNAISMFVSSFMNPFIFQFFSFVYSLTTFHTFIPWSNTKHSVEAARLKLEQSFETTGNLQSLFNALSVTGEPMYGKWQIHSNHKTGLLLLYYT